MSEFKFGCPVCGQHISCDTSQAGAVMTCPTCFQKIVAPQTPGLRDTKLILTGTKADERPAAKPFIPPPADAARKIPGSLIVGIILIFMCAVAAFVYHGTIFRTKPLIPATNQISAATNSSPDGTNEMTKTTNAPVEK